MGTEREQRWKLEGWEIGPEKYAGRSLVIKYTIIQSGYGIITNKPKDIQMQNDHVDKLTLKIIYWQVKYVRTTYELTEIEN